MKRSLLLGCGHKRDKRLGSDQTWVGELTTLDMNPDCGADVIWDLDQRPLPFPDEHFDEIAAYDVLEHVGRQGDWRSWFDEMAEYWRIMKPGAEFGIVVPTGKDAFADPGHTRFFETPWFAFLNQAHYDEHIRQGRAMTDYRWYWKLNFEIAFYQRIEDHHLAVILLKR